MNHPIFLFYGWYKHVWTIGLWLLCQHRMDIIGLFKVFFQFSQWAIHHLWILIGTVFISWGLLRQMVWGHTWIWLVVSEMLNMFNHRSGMMIFSTDWLRFLRPVAQPLDFSVCNHWTRVNPTCLTQGLWPLKVLAIYLDHECGKEKMPTSFQVIILYGCYWVF